MIQDPFWRNSFLTPPPFGAGCSVPSALMPKRKLLCTSRNTSAFTDPWYAWYTSIIVVAVFTRTTLRKTIRSLGTATSSVPCNRLWATRPREALVLVITQALMVGRMFEKKGLFYHVTRDHIFKDEMLFYRFAGARGLGCPLCHWMAKHWDGSSAFGAVFGRKWCSFPMVISPYHPIAHHATPHHATPRHATPRHTRPTQHNQHNTQHSTAQHSTA